MDDDVPLPSMTDYLRALRRRMVLAVVVAVLVAGATFAYIGGGSGGTYSATSRLVAPDPADSGDPLDQIGASRGAEAEARAMEAPDMEAAAEAALGFDPSVGVSGDGQSGIVTVTATESSENRAVDAVNTYATLFVERRREARLQQITTALEQVDGSIAGLRAEVDQDGPDAATAQALLDSYLSIRVRLEVQSTLGFRQVDVLEPAADASGSGATGTVSRVAVALVLGLIAGAVAVMAAELFGAGRGRAQVRPGRADPPAAPPS